MSHREPRTNEPLVSRQRTRRRVVEVGMGDATVEKGETVETRETSVTAENATPNMQARAERIQRKQTMIDDYAGISFWKKKDRSSPGFGEFIGSPLARSWRFVYQCVRDGNIKQAEVAEPELEQLFNEHVERMTALETRRPEEHAPRERLRDVQWMAWELNRHITQLLAKMEQTGGAVRLNEEECAQLQSIADRCAKHLRTCTNIIPKTASDTSMRALEQNESALRQLVNAAEQAFS